ncbi:MAG: hypothetical protein ACR2PK_05300 [Acidimicrobiales bacterium]
MKKLILLLLVGLAIAVGYMLGTEDGRAQRDRIIAALNERRGKSNEIDLSDAVDAATDAVDDVDLDKVAAKPA